MILTVTANPTIDRVYFIDDFEIGKVHRAGRVACSAGGKGINVARVAKLLGREVAAMGFVGGYTGDFIQSEVEKLGIKNLFTTIAGETRTCVNVTDKNGASGEILEQGPEVTSEEKNRFIKEYTRCMDSCNIICVSGSLPRGLTGSFYAELIRIAKANGKRIIVDVGGNVLEEILSEKPYMVKPNQDEVSLLMKKEISSDEDVKEALFYLQKKGVEVPFVSMGKSGASILADGVCRRFITPSVKTINTVGSGDSSVSGIACGLDMDYNLEDAVKLGMAAGVANTQFEQTGIVTKELVEMYFSQISVKNI